MVRLKTWLTIHSRWKDKFLDSGVRGQGFKWRKAAVCVNCPEPQPTKPASCNQTQNTMTRRRKKGFISGGSWCFGLIAVWQFRRNAN